MPERVLICGSRSWTDSAAVRRVIDALPDGTTIIHGGAPGADSLAGAWAKLRGLTVEVFPADWYTHLTNCRCPKGQRFCAAQGPARNAQMLCEGKPDRVVAFRMRGVSRGTDDMTRQARAAGLPVEVIEDDSPVADKPVDD